MNCLRPRYFVRQCKSLHQCMQEVHVDETLSPTNAAEQPVVSNTAVGLRSNSLLMTCRVMVSAPDGSSIEARAILDSALSASFISEHLAQSLCLPCCSQTPGFQVSLESLTSLPPNPSLPVTSLPFDHRVRRSV